MLKAEIEMKILDKEFYKKHSLPRYEHPTDAGVDLRAYIKESVVLQPEDTHMFPTGIAINMQNPYMVGLVMPRSGLGTKHGIVLANLTGVIDSGYQGEIYVTLWNRGWQPYKIVRGERIAQLLFMPIIRADFKVVELFETSDRALGKLGSTGKF